MQISNNSKKLLGSFSILLSGSFAAGLLNLIFYPLFSRLYTKEDFGILTALTSVVSFLCIFSTGKYEQAVIIAKDKKEALGLLAIAFSLCASFCTITLLLFLTGFSKIVSWLFHSDTVGTFLWLCPFAVIGISVYNCYNEWSVRGKKYVALSCNRFYNSSLITGCKVALFFFTGRTCFR